MRLAGPWRFDATLLLLLEVSLAFLVSMSAAGLLLGRLSGTEANRLVFPLATGGFHGLVLLLVARFVRSHQLDWRGAFGVFGPGWGRVWRWAAVLTLPAFGVTVAVHQACLWALAYFGAPPEAQAAVVAVQQATRIWERVLLFVFAVITAPVVEEVLFRGVLWPLVRRPGWRIWGCVGVSLLFAAFHGNAAALVPLWVLGAFWTWLYERTGDLTGPILSHSLFNAANFAWLILSTSKASP